jgi:hypothetical protein
MDSSTNQNIDGLITAINEKDESIFKIKLLYQMDKL